MKLKDYIETIASSVARKFGYMCRARQSLLAQIYLRYL